MKTDVKEYVYELLKIVGVRGLKIIGNNIRCQCPIHFGKNVSSFSLTLDEIKGYPWQCWSCHESGNLISLIMLLNKISYKQARKVFRKNVLVSSINLDSLSNILQNIRKEKSDLLNNIPEIDMPLRYNGEPMIKYLDRRNTAKHHGLLNIDYVISLYDLYYCDSGRYNRRIIMPIRDYNGRYIYFTNRSLVANNEKNLFVKGSTASDFLYGLYETQNRKKCVLVEGPFDVFHLKCYMMNNDIMDYGIIGNLGTKFSETKAGILAEIFDKCYILFDHDEAGLDGEKKVFEILSDYMPTFKMTKTVPKGKDPGKCTKEQLDKLFRFKCKAGLKIGLL